MLRPPTPTDVARSLNQVLGKFKVQSSQMKTEKDGMSRSKGISVKEKQMEFEERKSFPQVDRTQKGLFICRRRSMSK